MQELCKGTTQTRMCLWEAQLWFWLLSTETGTSASFRHQHRTGTHWTPPLVPCLASCQKLAKNGDYPKYGILKPHTQQILPFFLDPARKQEKNPGIFSRALELLKPSLKATEKPCILMPPMCWCISLCYLQIINLLCALAAGRLSPSMHPSSRNKAPKVK